MRERAELSWCLELTKTCSVVLPVFIRLDATAMHALGVLETESAGVRALHGKPKKETKKREEELARCVRVAGLALHLLWRANRRFEHGLELTVLARFCESGV